MKDNTEEKDQDQLNELGEEVEYNRINVVSMAQMVKGTLDEGLRERAQRALDKSMEAARIGQQKLAGLRIRLKFHSMDSEAGSYTGRLPQGTGGVALGQPPTAGGGGHPGGDFFFSSGQDMKAHPESRGRTEQEGEDQTGPVDLTNLLRDGGS